MLGLNQDITLNIFKHLDVYDIVNCSEINKVANKFINSTPQIWNIVACALRINDKTNSKESIKKFFALNLGKDDARKKVRGLSFVENMKCTSSQINNHLMQAEILADLKTLESTKGYSERSAIKDIIKSKLEYLLRNAPLGTLETYFIQALSSTERALHFKPNFQFYKELDAFVRLQHKEKQGEIENLGKKLIYFNNDLLLRTNVIPLVKPIYLSGNNDLINLFKELLPLPPTSLFREEEQTPPPQDLVQRETERHTIVEKFKERHSESPELQKLEAKIMYIQRHIRGLLRLVSEAKRIGERYFKGDSEAEIKALKMIKEANTPYIPQKCSFELSQRIMQAAEEITLYSSVTHLLSSSNIGIILDSVLYGRNNLLDLYINFRSAALMSDDVANGDGNVICMGPNLIDDRSLKNRTAGIELDLVKLLKEDTFNKNPAIFFKQMDLGYIVDKQTLDLKGTPLYFNHTSSLPDWIKKQNSHCHYLQLYDDYGRYVNYFAEIPNDLLISSNLKKMDKILILNFFRFLDNLKDLSGNDANDQIKALYSFLSSLNKEELHAFLQDLGQKMSCSSELNFFGAYKIDLNILLSITIYEKGRIIDKIKISDLCEELNTGNFKLLNSLKKNLPEIFKSSKFIAFLKEKVTHPEVLEAILR